MPRPSSAEVNTASPARPLGPLPPGLLSRDVASASTVSIGNARALRASQWGREAVRTLLRLREVEPDARTRSRLEQLQAECRSLDPAVLAQTLSARPWLTRLSDKSGDTLLSWMIKDDRLDLVEAILPFCDVRACNRMGQTPLMWAARLARPQAVQLLLPHSNVGQMDRHGNTALMLVCEPVREPDEQKVACARLLLAHGEAGATNHDGCTAVFFAFYAMNWATAAVLAQATPPDELVRAWKDCQLAWGPQASQWGSLVPMGQAIVDRYVMAAAIQSAPQRPPQSTPQRDRESDRASVCAADAVVTPAAESTAASPRKRGRRL